MDAIASGELRGPDAERAAIRRFEIAEHYSGPLPPPLVLKGYDEIVPGSAARIIDTHLRGEHAVAASLERLTAAEAFAVRWGTIAGPVVALGSFTAAAGLIVAGLPIASIAALVPAVLGATAQMLVVKRSLPGSRGRAR